MELGNIRARRKLDPDSGCGSIFTVVLEQPAADIARGYADDGVFRSSIVRSAAK
jgi:hypothetical protein